MDTVQVTALEGQLGSLLESIKEKDTLESWDAVGSVCRSIANSLRTRGEGADTHTLLGKSSLPQNLASLITLALHGSPYPSDEYTAPIFEMLRVSANLCLDHDPNRGYILEAGLPQVIVSLLEGYAERTSSPATIVPLDLSIAHLHVVRTAIGVLLNASLGYDAVKFRLISLETAVTIIKLSATIYPPMSWLGITFDETTKEAWTLRSGISSWAWRTVSELKDTKDDPKDESTRQILGPDVLPWVTPALSRFMPPYEIAANPSLLSDSSFYTNLVNTDFETLEETCTLLESLSLDVEDIRLALARGYCFPAEHLGVSCFKTMVDFIEDGSYPPTWNHPTISRDDRERKEKKFNICKAALIKSVVEVAGEEKNGDVLWDDSIEDKPGGVFVYTMAKWIREYVEAVEREPAASHRDDLVICASLSLGNLSRREKTSTALLSSPISLAPVLASDHFFSPSTDVKLKHGILGLLKHIAQSSNVSPIIPRSLADAHIVQKINESAIWDEGADAMAVIVQLNAIGVVKHLCNADVEHAIAAALPPPGADPDYKTALQKIMALVSRSDSVPIKSEGTRVLVNVIRTVLLRRNASLSSSARIPADKDKQQAIDTVMTPDNLNALSAFLARSGKFPILINEGVVAFNLICTQKGGANLVLDAILAPIQDGTIPEATPLSPVGSDASSPLSPTAKKPFVARTALEMIANALRNVDNPAVYPIEIRANICTFLVQLSRNTSGPKLAQVQDATRLVLEKIREAKNEKEDLLTNAATKVLEYWKSA
ncbi:hypothetical protein D9611_004655 [Ephemerocybe angulata]|uniref:Uncharacterized protein n=1 Tax=Ephemerocybe angulata TaxID=980116 RepID=A0A8H5EX42_9AGAR|nr:hypothetical protein D9611_004655 [Tulosesus angulatus]